MGRVKAITALSGVEIVLITLVVGSALYLNSLIPVVVFTFLAGFVAACLALVALAKFIFKAMIESKEI